jgi:hypothetical protein
MILISLSLAGGVFYLLQQEKANSSKLKSSLEDITNKYDVVKREKKDLSRRFSGAKKFLFSYDRLASKSKGQIKDLKDALKQQEVIRQIMEKEMGDLKIEMEKVKIASVDLQNKLTDANTFIKKSDEQLKDALTQKSALEKQVEELRTQAQKVELGTIVVGSDAGKPPVSTPVPAKESRKEKAKKTDKPEKAPAAALVSPPEPVKQTVASKAALPGSGLEGKVLVLNKDYNFAVINLGSKDGVKLGDIFSVYHNDTFIGDVKVEKIHDSMSAAGFSSPETGTTIRENDKVVLKK